MNIDSFDKYPKVLLPEFAQGTGLPTAAHVVVRAVLAVVRDHHSLALHEWPGVFIKIRGVWLSCIMALGVFQEQLDHIRVSLGSANLESHRESLKFQ